MVRIRDVKRWAVLAVLLLAGGGAAARGELVFCPEVEETVADGWVVDFDKETVVKLPETMSWFGNEAERVRWSESEGPCAWAWSGGDPRKAGDRKGGGLFGSEMIVIKAKGEDFEMMSPDQVVAELGKKSPELNGPMQPRGEFPATYLIMTPTGGRGIVQILGLGERAVKIKYRMIELVGGMIPMGPGIDTPEPPARPGRSMPAPSRVEKPPVPEKPVGPGPAKPQLPEKPAATTTKKGTGAREVAARRGSLEQRRWLDIVTVDHGELPDGFLKKLDLAHAGVYEKAPYPGWSLEEGKPFPARGQRTLVLYMIVPDGLHLYAIYFPGLDYFVVWDTTDGRKVCYGPFKGSPRDVWPLPKLTEPAAWSGDDRTEADRTVLLERKKAGSTAGVANGNTPGSAVALGKLVLVNTRLGPRLGIPRLEVHELNLEVTAGGKLPEDFLQRLDFSKVEMHERYAPGYITWMDEVRPASRQVTSYTLNARKAGLPARFRAVIREPGIYVDYFPELDFFTVVDARLMHGPKSFAWCYHYGPFKGDPMQVGKGGAEPAPLPGLWAEFAGLRSGTVKMGP